MINGAMENRVKHVVFTSSDKAVNPTSVMGTSKLMCERLISAANNSNFDSGQNFSSTRFGNILGSNGSVVEILHNQISSCVFNIIYVQSKKILPKKYILT